MWRLTSVLGTPILSHISNVFVGVNSFALTHCRGFQDPDFEEAPGLCPRGSLWCEDCNPPEVEVQSGNV